MTALALTTYVVIQKSVEVAPTGDSQHANTIKTPT